MLWHGNTGRQNAGRVDSRGVQRWSYEPGQASSGGTEGKDAPGVSPLSFPVEPWCLSSGVLWIRCPDQQHLREERAHCSSPFRVTVSHFGVSRQGLGTASRSNSSDGRMNVHTPNLSLLPLLLYGPGPQTRKWRCSLLGYFCLHQ